MSTSFLQSGQWAKPAFALGFDPKAVVQRAIVTGMVSVSGEPQGPGWREVAKARTRASMRTARAHRSAAGKAVSTGQPLRNQRHPELRGLDRKEYLKAYCKKRRAALRAAGLNTLGKPLRPVRTAEEALAARRASNLAWNRRRRARLVQQGLTQAGRPRQSRQHPDLAGLKGRAYFKAWRAKMKAERAKA